MPLSRDAIIRLGNSFHRARPLWMNEKDDAACAVWRKMVEAVVASGAVPEQHFAIFADHAGYTLSVKEHNDRHDGALAAARRVA